MAEIRWTEEAHRWLREIHNYIATYNLDAAQKVVAGIYDKAQLLRQFLEIGYKYRTEPEGEIRILPLRALSNRLPHKGGRDDRYLGCVSWGARN